MDKTPNTFSITTLRSFKKKCIKCVLFGVALFQGSQLKCQKCALQFTPVCNSEQNI